MTVRLEIDYNPDFGELWLCLLEWGQNPKLIPSLGKSFIESSSQEGRTDRPCPGVYWERIARHTRLLSLQLVLVLTNQPGYLHLVHPDEPGRDQKGQG